MPDYRSYCPSLSQDASLITLSADESRHLISVNRARRGDPVTVFDGNGLEWTSEISDSDKQGTVLRGLHFKKHGPLPYNIALAQSIPKAKGLETIIRKATEMGIQRVFPILTERTEAKIRDDRQNAKNAKWHTAAIEGAKQSGNPFLPTIHPVLSLESFLEEQVTPFDIKLIASLQSDSLPLYSIVEQEGLPTPPSGLVLVGPEGDFTAMEYKKIKAAGFRAITLGPYVLKCETAAVKALSILQYEFSKL